MSALGCGPGPLRCSALAPLNGLVASTATTPLLVVVTVQSGLRSPPMGYFSKSSHSSALAGQPGPEVTGSDRSAEPSLDDAPPSRGAPDRSGFAASVELPGVPPVPVAPAAPLAPPLLTALSAGPPLPAVGSGLSVSASAVCG